jgi:hypothetical protein
MKLKGYNLIIKEIEIMTNSELKSKVMTLGNKLAPAWETAATPL